MAIFGKPGGGKKPAKKEVTIGWWAGFRANRAAKKRAKADAKQAAWMAKMGAEKQGAIENAKRTASMREAEQRHAPRQPPMGGKPIEAKPAVDPNRAALENPETVKRMAVKSEGFPQFAQACSAKGYHPQTVFMSGLKWLMEKDPTFWLDLEVAKDRAEDRVLQAETPEEKKARRFSATRFCAERILEKVLPKLPAKKQ